MWHPEADALMAVRNAILEDGAAWKKARDNAKFKANWELGGESLSRPPRGIDKDHPYIDDLRRKDHIAMCKLDYADVLGPNAVELIAARFAETKPYVAFLCKAIGQPF
jgi:uncharacterized protein (TIGR02453 family)